MGTERQIGLSQRSSWVNLESEGDRANADPQYQKLWRTLQRFARETSVSAAVVQWTRLVMKEPPTWSRLLPAQVSMRCFDWSETVKKQYKENWWRLEKKRMKTISLSNLNRLRAEAVKYTKLVYLVLYYPLSLCKLCWWRFVQN